MRITFILSMIFIANCSWFSKTSVNESTKQDTIVASMNTKSISQDTAFDICEKAFQEKIGSLNSSASFKPLFEFYKHHSNCLDGAYSQGIEGAISESLDNKWSNLAELNELFSSDSEFKSFFFKSIGCYVSATEKQLEAVIKKSKTSCPTNLKPLCAEIKTASEKALAYSRSQ